MAVLGTAQNIVLHFIFVIFKIKTSNRHELFFKFCLFRESAMERLRLEQNLMNDAQASVSSRFDFFA